jgi:hypothetical protein
MIVLRRFCSATLATSLIAVSIPTAAYAQTDDQRAGARAAGDAGLQAYNAKDWAACKDYFTRAQSLVDAPPLLLYIARCSVQLGQLVSAREAYLKIRREVVTPDKPQAFRDAKVNAETELAALEPRIPYLNINVTGGAGKTVSVKIDGADVPPALVGIPHPVDPGEHKLEASAEGMTAAPKAVTLQEGQRQDVTMELVAGAATPTPGQTGPATSDSSTPGTAPDQAPPTPVDTVSGKGPPLRTIGFVTMGVGVAGLVVGGVFFAQASSNSSDADSKYNQFHCAMSCTPDQQQQVKDLDNQASSARSVAFVSGGLGIVAVGVGLTLVLLPRHNEPPKQALTLTPVVGIGSLGLRGAF